VRSIDQAVAAHEHRPQIVDHFANDAEIVVSNVGDPGYELDKNQGDSTIVRIWRQLAFHQNCWCFCSHATTPARGRDLQPFKRLKLHILKLGHIVLTEEWLRRRRNSSETVRPMLGDPAVSAHLSTIYEEEVVPVCSARHA
jgi:mannitol-1-phosphate/altronate dehydrogenase